MLNQKPIDSFYFIPINYWHKVSYVSQKITKSVELSPCLYAQQLILPKISIYWERCSPIVDFLLQILDIKINEEYQ